MRARSVLVLLALLVSWTLAGPVAAAKPSISRENVDTGWFVDEEMSDICGFEVLVRLKGKVAERIWTDAEGNPTRIVFTINMHVTLSAGDNTVRLIDAGMDKITFFPDGGQLVQIHGNVRLTTVPGEGAVAGAAGLFAFTLTPLLDEEGNPVLDEEGFPIFEFEVVKESGISLDNVEAVCEALAA